MSDPVTVEIVGLADMACSPFPCDETRSCGLEECHPTGSLIPAFHALRTALAAEFGNRVELKLTLIDDGVPLHIRKILEEESPPLPIVIVNGKATRIGRISRERIAREIEPLV